MKLVCQIVSWAALAFTLLPSAVFLAGKASLESVKLQMLIATIVWFVATPLWMERAEG